MQSEHGADPDRYFTKAAVRMLAAELDIAMRHVNRQMDRAQGLLDLQLALFNLGEFLLRH